jgi:hypothetical protein
MKKTIFFGIIICICLIISSFISYASNSINFDNSFGLDQTYLFDRSNAGGEHFSVANLDNNIEFNQIQFFDRPTRVYSEDDELLLELLGIKNILVFRYPDYDGEVELMSFETSTGVDFIKVYATNGAIGVRSEYAWVQHNYPGFERLLQAFMWININGVRLPCDLLIFFNRETNETRQIYFEISEFFGR